MPGDLCTAPQIISLSPLSLATDVTDATLGASGLWLETRTGAGGTAILTESFFFFLAAAHGSMDNRVQSFQILSNMVLYSMNMTISSVLGLITYKIIKYLVLSQLQYLTHSMDLVTRRFNAGFAKTLQ